MQLGTLIASTLFVVAAGLNVMPASSQTPTLNQAEILSAVEGGAGLPVGATMADLVDITEGTDAVRTDRRVKRSGSGVTQRITETWEGGPFPAPSTFSFSPDPEVMDSLGAVHGHGEIREYQVPAKSWIVR